MIKSKEIAGPSCLTNARDDEPIFVLRANDELAPLTVRFWATQYFKQKARQTGGATSVQRAKHFEALGLADAMHRWKQRAATAQISSMTGVPIESVEKILVDGEVKFIGVDPAEPQRIGDEVLSGCAVRAAIQRERFSEQDVQRAFASVDVPVPTSSEHAELMAKLGMKWLEANDPSKLTELQQRAHRVCKLASELCNAIDAAEEDIGGHRAVADILKELGPACDEYEGR